MFLEAEADPLVSGSLVIRVLVIGFTDLLINGDPLTSLSKANIVSIL